MDLNDEPAFAAHEPMPVPQALPTVVLQPLVLLVDRAPYLAGHVVVCEPALCAEIIAAEEARPATEAEVRLAQPFVRPLVG